MKFYIDFEATSPENEIIAIGAVSESGSTFYSLVKPQLSCISQYISELTRISSKDLETAKTIDEVFVEFNSWAAYQEPDIMKRQYISYGEDDKFIKATLPAIHDSRAYVTAAILMAKMEDCTSTVKKFFHGSISLIHAFNFVQAASKEQIHNPLDDAKMLQTVLEYTYAHAPLEDNPIHPKNPVVYTSPRGNFWCRTSSKNAKTREFDTCEEAIDWLIQFAMKIPEKDRASVHRDRIMRNIMKALKKKEKYCGYYWGRMKDGKKEGV